MKSLEKIIRKMALAGTLAAAAIVSGCGGSGGGTASSPTSPKNPPVVQTIGEQQVEEGKALSLNLAPFVTSKSAYTLKQTSGPGTITGTTYAYQDKRDNDKVNNRHTVGFSAIGANGATARGSFDIQQQDTYYRLPPTFFNAKKNWIAYAPTNFDPNQGIFPSEQSMQDDLDLLAATNFKGVFTYGSDGTLNKVPMLARNTGFQHVLMGIWDPKSQEEWNNAVAAKNLVDGYIIGNEGIGQRYTMSELETAIENLRYATDKPVTTTEITGMYTNQQLMQMGDWLFPNDHPYWSGITDPNRAAAYIVQAQQGLASQTSLSVVMKEAGMPSAGNPSLSEQGQNTFFRELERLTWSNPRTTYTYFEAFDQPWKVTAPVEPHWGYFNSDRTQKEAAQRQIAFTKVPPIGSTQDLEGRAINFADPSQERVSVYIKVNGTWWMKPYWASPLTAIKSNYTWKTDITTGGNDPSATEINASLVDPSFVPVRNTLPQLSNPLVHYQISVTR